MRHILVPTDFGERALAALEYAIEFCQGSPGRITLLHVLQTEKAAETLMGLDAIGHLANTLELPPSSSGCTPSFNVNELKKLAQQKLEECIDASWSKAIPIDTALEEGRPSDKIIEYARDYDVDLIVMGTHGRGPVAHFFLGSVAENVIRSADCPVLTVRNKRVSVRPHSEGS